MKKLGDKRHSQKPLPGENVGETRIHTQVLLSLTSGSRIAKELNVITEDCLCVMQKLKGGTKALTSRISKLFEECNQLM